MPWPNGHHTATIAACKGYRSNWTIRDIWRPSARQYARADRNSVSPRRPLPTRPESIAAIWGESSAGSVTCRSLISSGLLMRWTFHHRSFLRARVSKARSIQIVPPQSIADRPLSDAPFRQRGLKLAMKLQCPLDLTRLQMAMHLLSRQQLLATDQPRQSSIRRPGSRAFNLGLRNFDHEIYVKCRRKQYCKSNGVTSADPQRRSCTQPNCRPNPSTSDNFKSVTSGGSQPICNAPATSS
jgi:hypothetical protein